MAGAYAYINVCGGWSRIYGDMENCRGTSQARGNLPSGAIGVGDYNNRILCWGGGEYPTRAERLGLFKSAVEYPGTGMSAVRRAVVFTEYTCAVAVRGSREGAVPFEDYAYEHSACAFDKKKAVGIARLLKCYFSIAPFESALRYALINPSNSPSITAWTLPFSKPVLWSLTRVYGMKTYERI